MPNKKLIAAICGGTGGYTLLRGLKNYFDNISAIVNMTDNGGSSGRLRDELGILPPGDGRQCLVALADDDGFLRELFNFRFTQGKTLKDHSLGNLMISAAISMFGSLPKALEELGKILRIKGEVLPITLQDSHVCARLENGEVIKGEDKIDQPNGREIFPIVKIWLSPETEIYNKAEERLREADVVVIPPGSLYTTILPNLSVKGVPEAVRDKPIIYVGNLMTEYGQTGFGRDNNMDGAEHVKIITEYLGRSLTAVIVNTQLPPGWILERYGGEFSFPVRYDPKKLKELGVVDIIKANLISKSAARSGLYRHDSYLLARAIDNYVKYLYSD